MARQRRKSSTKKKQSNKCHWTYRALMHYTIMNISRTNNLGPKPFTKTVLRRAFVGHAGHVKRALPSQKWLTSFEKELQTNLSDSYLSRDLDGNYTVTDYARGRYRNARRRVREEMLAPHQKLEVLAKQLNTEMGPTANMSKAQLIGCKNDLERDLQQTAVKRPRAQPLQAWSSISTISDVGEDDREDDMVDEEGSQGESQQVSIRPPEDELLRTPRLSPAEVYPSPVSMRRQYDMPETPVTPRRGSSGPSSVLGRAPLLLDTGMDIGGVEATPRRASRATPQSQAAIPDAVTKALVAELEAEQALVVAQLRNECDTLLNLIHDLCDSAILYTGRHTEELNVYGHMLVGRDQQILNLHEHNKVLQHKADAYSHLYQFTRNQLERIQKDRRCDKNVIDFLKTLYGYQEAWLQELQNTEARFKESGIKSADGMRAELAELREYKMRAEVTLQKQEQRLKDLYSQNADAFTAIESFSRRIRDNLLNKQQAALNVSN